MQRIGSTPSLPMQVGSRTADNGNHNAGAIPLLLAAWTTLCDRRACSMSVLQLCGHGYSVLGMVLQAFQPLLPNAKRRATSRECPDDLRCCGSHHKAARTQARQPGLPWAAARQTSPEEKREAPQERWNSGGRGSVRTARGRCNIRGRARTATKRHAGARTSRRGRNLTTTCRFLPGKARPYTPQATCREVCRGWSLVTQRRRSRAQCRSRRFSQCDGLHPGTYLKP